MSNNNTSYLPKITLPSFAGSFDSWLGFHDLFNSLVNEDSRIPPIQKLFYLRGCLVGEAAEVIAAIELSADNYQIAWDLLKERYDNRKIIRQSHTKAILNMACISKEFTVRALLDNFQKHFRALKALGEPVESWNTILIVVLLEKFNHFLRERWEDFSNDCSNPTIDQMISFLQRRAQLEDTKSYQSSTKPPQTHDKGIHSSRPISRKQQSYATATSSVSCHHCQGNHYLTLCKKFSALSPQARYEAVKKASLCTNCLRKGHFSTSCSAGKCRTCDQKHHTLLHFHSLQKNRATHERSDETENSNTVHPSSVNLHASVVSETLLATAIVDIVNKSGKTKSCRVFLDAGSQAHFITESTAKFLKLDRKSVNISVTGVDDTSTHIKHLASATVKSKFNNFQKNVEFLIVPRITQMIPSLPINRANLQIPNNIILADPDFSEPSNIDALIGVKLFYKLLCVGQISLKDQPDAILQKTQLGWIIAGEISSSRTNHVNCHLVVNSSPADTNLTRFWEVEEIPVKNKWSSEETLCENHFALNTKRDAEGRYIVRLPFNSNKAKLGASYSLAVRRLYSLENRLSKNQDLKREYSEFLSEYHDLNHMSRLKIRDYSSNGFYLPHHAVIKQESTTTKIRVVFDGSAKTSTGISLNEALMVGPKIQDDLFSILTRFRLHSIALTADIEKMYRQIRVHHEDSCYQKILFRNNPKDPIEEYTLDTVTYGTSCASFLAIRSLQQLAEDEGTHHPSAATVLKRDFYVDDLLTGAATKQEAEILRDELLKLLKKGGFHLRKWASNDPSLIPDHLGTQNNANLSLDLDSTVKTLGLQWNAHEDKIIYSVKITKDLRTITKRTILSQIAKLFDPLGLLGPIIVHAKILIQLLWKADVNWDESVPLEIHTLWSVYKEQLPLIEGLRFDRHILVSEPVNIQIHGFCDASERAYGACVYLRSVDKSGKIIVKLISSKSRVAPVKSLTLPRLELCGALLLSRLFSTIKESLPVSFDAVYLWSDSTIALCWINTPPHSLKTFVSNRVSEIRELTQSCQWRHVPSEENPADFISRGQTPREFAQNTTWQHGPRFLDGEIDSWPLGKLTISEIPELKPLFPSRICTKIELNDASIVERYSSLSRLRRIIAYIYRFLNNVKNKSDRYHGRLSRFELDKANKTILRITQATMFNKEIHSLKINEPLHGKSRLIPLNPFLDEDGILRVGGRLANASIPNDQRHPILLPSDHNVTRLIIRDEHLRLKHAGSQATLYSVRQQYWPLNGRNVTRQIIHRCVTCFRLKPRTTDHPPGVLPSHRVTPSRPFLNVGVDFCGPFYIKEKRHRNRNKIKTYVSVYVCLSTKAVHLELVSDLTTESFLASLKRFFSRRGKSSAIYSDNATNFVGAKNKLNELYKLFSSENHIQLMQRYCDDEKISWHFIPPKSPHFGGIWEAAVKSFKHHLLRTVGEALFTFDQLETFIIEIEAILNSRPLSPMSSDPNDLIPLTPGHFLVGGTLTSFPQEDFTNTPPNRLSAWQHAQQLKHHFWRRWNKEYLNHLISSKQRFLNANSLQIGTLVLIKEDNLPPLRWSLGRIVAVHPGEDGVIRVVTLKTMLGEYKRCVKKLCPLPLEE